MNLTKVKRLQGFVKGSPGQYYQTGGATQDEIPYDPAAQYPSYQEVFGSQITCRDDQRCETKNPGEKCYIAEGDSRGICLIPPEDGDCHLDTDCPTGQICQKDCNLAEPLHDARRLCVRRFGTCIVPGGSSTTTSDSTVSKGSLMPFGTSSCSADSPCESNYQCIEGVNPDMTTTTGSWCVQSAPEPYCLVNDDCPDGQTCDRADLIAPRAVGECVNASKSVDDLLSSVVNSSLNGPCNDFQLCNNGLHCDMNTSYAGDTSTMALMTDPDNPNPSYGTCKQCLDDTHCPPGSACSRLTKKCISTTDLFGCAVSADCSTSSSPVKDEDYRCFQGQCYPKEGAKCATDYNCGRIRENTSLDNTGDYLTGFPRMTCTIPAGATEGVCSLPEEIIADTGLPPPPPPPPSTPTPAPALVPSPSPSPSPSPAPAPAPSPAPSPSPAPAPALPTEQPAALAVTDEEGDFFWDVGIFIIMAVVVVGACLFAFYIFRRQRDKAPFRLSYGPETTVPQSSSGFASTPTAETELARGDGSPPPSYSPLSAPKEPSQYGNVFGDSGPPRSSVYDIVTQRQPPPVASAYGAMTSSGTHTYGGMPSSSGYGDITI